MNSYHQSFGRMMQKLDEELPLLYSIFIRIQCHFEISIFGHVSEQFHRQKRQHA